MLASGVSVTSQMAISKMIEQMQWPYWYLLASCCLMAGVVNALHVWWQGIACPQREDIKWVLARAVFENFHWIGAMLSVIVGAAPGDVAALTSIDIIAAALLGLVFLGERVSILHLFALILSVAGVSRSTSSIRFHTFDDVGVCFFTLKTSAKNSLMVSELLWNPKR